MTYAVITNDNYNAPELEYFDDEAEAESFAQSIGAVVQPIATDEDVAALDNTQPTHKIAIFAHGDHRWAKWEDLAWAYVADDDEACDLAHKHMYFSWTLDDDEQSKRMDFFKKSVTELK